MRITAFFLALLTGTVACPAALVWKSTDLNLKAEPGQEAISVIFPFRNAGDRPVRILSLDPSCSCMSASPDKPVCAPGESSEIRVELTLTGYTGRVHRSISVTTDDATGQFAELTLTVEIPELVVITPRFLFWRVGDIPDEKAAEVVVTDPKTTTLKGVECANLHFQAKLTHGQPGVYRLAIAPSDTRQPDEAMIHLNTTVGGRSQTFVIYAAVK